MSRKKPPGPTCAIIQPATTGPKIAPSPFRKISPALAAGHLLLRQEVVGIGDQQRIERVDHAAQQHRRPDKQREGQRQRKAADQHGDRPDDATAPRISLRRSIRSDAQPMGYWKHQPAHIHARR